MLISFFSSSRRLTAEKIIARERLGTTTMHRPSITQTAIKRLKDIKNITQLIPPPLNTHFSIAMSDMAIEQKGLTTRIA